MGEIYLFFLDTTIELDVVKDLKFQLAQDITTMIVTTKLKRSKWKKLCRYNLHDVSSLFCAKKKHCSGLSLFIYFFYLKQQPGSNNNENERIKS